MCSIWKYPTHPHDEVTLDTLDKIPHGIDYLNLTGGEPTLRQDLPEIVDLLYPRAMQLEISSNGLYTERLEPLIRKYPDIKIRLSLEGFESKNNSIRGEKDGFNKKINGLLRLKKLGGKDLGFAITIQDDNAEEVVDIFRFAEKHGFELATSTLHNGFQFHKSDNVPYDRLRVARLIENLIVTQLKTKNIKNWFRGYLNLGLIAKVLGHDRMLTCTAATDFIFIDPWSDVYACNVRPDLLLGNLADQSWDHVNHSERATEIRGEVAQCKQNCWMVGSAKTAMRHPRFAKIPKGGPLLWVLMNKFKVTAGMQIPFNRYIDYAKVHMDVQVPKREFFLEKSPSKTLQRKDDVHYVHLGDFFNK